MKNTAFCMYHAKGSSQEYLSTGRGSIQNAECQLSSARSGTDPLEEDPPHPKLANPPSSSELAARALHVICGKLMLRERALLTECVCRMADSLTPDGCVASAIRRRR